MKLHPPSKNFLIVAAIFLVTRVWLIFSGIRPDFDHLRSHHQYLDLPLLAGNLASSLFYLHSQPPLWNAIIGVLLKISHGDPSFFSVVYIVFSLPLSLAIAFMLDRLVLNLSGSETTALAASLFYAVFSSAYFYEFYIFYPLFTAFLSTGCIYGASLVFLPKHQTRLFPGLAILLVCLISLTLTWSLFHPVLVVIVCTFLFFRLYFHGLVSERKNLLAISPLLVFSILAAFAVPIKNFILFGYFGSSTWGGMNLAQVAPRSGENINLLHQCSDFHPANYREYQLALEMVRPGVGYHNATMKIFKSDELTPNLNNIGLIQRSRKCAKLATQEILNDFRGYAAGRMDQFIHTFLMLSDSYFYYPLGLRGLIVEKVISIRNVVYLPRRGTYLAPFIALGTTLLTPALLWVNKKAFRKGSLEVACLSLFVILWTLVLAYLVNGLEQNRMRFTVEPLLIFMVAVFVRGIFGARFR